MSQRVGIVGSRSYPFPERVERYVDDLPDDTIVVSGGACGMDTVAALHARRRGLTVVEHRPDLTGCRTRWEFTVAYYVRNQTVVDDVDRLVAFTERSKGGTWDTIWRAHVRDIPVEVRS